jgi:L-threonylcarbamoyladenylate synthase
MPQIIEINPIKPEHEPIRKAVEILRGGGVAAFPTETFYGLAVDPMNPSAVERLFRIKGRTFRRAIALITGSRIDIEEYTAEIPTDAKRLMTCYWPGPLTLVFAASKRIDTRLSAGTGKIGIRVSSHPIAEFLSNKLGGPITATSANLSGAAECCTAEEVLAIFGNKIDLIIDGGPTPGGKGSTFVDVTTDPPQCLREGVIPSELILSSIGKVKKY